MRLSSAQASSLLFGKAPSVRKSPRMTKAGLHHLRRRQQIRFW